VRGAQPAGTWYAYKPAHRSARLAGETLPGSWLTDRAAEFLGLAGGGILSPTRWPLRSMLARPLSDHYRLESSGCPDA
jgi:hypothetical protein